jgi:hypothetical protein
MMIYVPGMGEPLSSSVENAIDVEMARPETKTNGPGKILNIVRGG